MKTHPKKSNRRRGITFVELMLASSITALTATASATLLYAISSSATQTRDYRTQRQTGNYALNMLGRTIREARAIVHVSSDDIGLWMNDANENDAVDNDELGRIVFDSAKKQIRFDYFDDSGAPAPVAAPSAAIFSDRAVMASTMSGSRLQTAVWADEVTSAAFTGYPDSVETRVVQAQFSIDASGDSLLFHIAASPRAPGDYLFYREAKIAADIRSPRVKRKVFSKWSGLGAGLGTLTKVITDLLK
jgi:hypothetical protein